MCSVHIMSYRFGPSGGDVCQFCKLRESEPHFAPVKVTSFFLLLKWEACLFLKQLNMPPYGEKWYYKSVNSRSSLTISWMFCLISISSSHIWYEC